MNALGACRSLAIPLTLALSVALCGSAGAQDNDWIAQQFKTPTNPKETKSSAAQRHRETAEAIKRFSEHTFLGPDDTRAYQQNIQALIGNYFFLQKTGSAQALQLVGKSDAVIKELRTEIKDGIVFRAILQQNWKAGATLPFLAVKLGREEIAEIVVQDNVAVVAERPVADAISCGFPVGWEQEAKISQFYFITAAAVSSITSRRFNRTNADGNGTFSVIKLDGSYYYSDEQIIKQNVVAIAKIPVKLLSAEQKQRACKKQDATPKIAPPTTLRLDSVTPSLMPSLGRSQVLQPLDTFVPELSGKVLNVRPSPKL